MLALISKFDPLGAKSASGLQSESVLLRLSAPWYGSVDNPAQKKITVVLIDDQYLKKIKSFWPMSYLDQDQLLMDILDYHPQAVFLDLLYHHKHGEAADLQQFVDTIAEAATKTSPAVPISIPVLLKDIEGQSSCDVNGLPLFFTTQSIVVENSVIPELLDSPTHKTYVGWTGCSNRYPGFVIGDSQFPTPAFALYADHCRRQQTPLSRDTNSCAEVLAGDLHAFVTPMMVRWGQGMSHSRQMGGKKSNICCTTLDCERLKNKWAYAWSQVKSAVRQCFSSSPDRGRMERCTYTDTLHATWFLGGDSNREYLQGMLENRIVLIGTQIEGVHDMIHSPVNGQLPGVYLLAMALDNYLEYGANYYKDITGKKATAIEIITLFMTIFGMNWLRFKILLIKQYHSFFSAPWRQEAVIAGQLFLYKGLIPVSVCLPLAWGMWQLRYAPMDWLGVALIAFVANPISIKDCCHCHA